KSDFAIYSRAEMDRMMRQRAVDAGAKFIAARVARIIRASSRWELTTQAGAHYFCDLLVGADGATSKIRRRLGVEFAPQDYCYALGWHVRENNPESSASTRVDIRYLKSGTGYIWGFP